MNCATRAYGQSIGLIFLSGGPLPPEGIRGIDISRRKKHPHRPPVRGLGHHDGDGSRRVSAAVERGSQPPSYKPRYTTNAAPATTPRIVSIVLTTSFSSVALVRSHHVGVMPVV